MIVYERYIYRKLKRRRLVKKSNKLNGRWNKIKREGENEVETKEKERKKIRSSSIQNETSDPSLSRVHPSQNSPLYQIKHRSKNYQNTLDEDKEGKQEGEYKYRIKKKKKREEGWWPPVVYHGSHEWLERALLPPPRRKSEVEKLDEEACAPPRGEILFPGCVFCLFPLSSLWYLPDSTPPVPSTVATLWCFSSN